MTQENGSRTGRPTDARQHRRAGEHSTEAGIAAWLGAQMAMPASLHRAEFRLNSNPPMAVPLQGTGTSRPCGADALWQRHAVSRLDEGEA